MSWNLAARHAELVALLTEQEERRVQEREENKRVETARAERDERLLTSFSALIDRVSQLVTAVPGVPPHAL